MTGTHVTLERALADYFRGYDVVHAKVIGSSEKPVKAEVVLVLAAAIDAAMLRYDVLMAVAHAAPSTQALPAISRLAAECYVRERAYEAATERGWL